jgi:hypothetical protein
MDYNVVVFNSFQLKETVGDRTKTAQVLRIYLSVRYNIKRSSIGRI